MGEIKGFQKYKLIIGILSTLNDREDDFISILEKEFSSVDYKSRRFPFSYTSYYDKEMGEPITRFFLSFKKLVSPDDLAGIKIHTNYLENFFAVKTSAGLPMRKVNFDPGILNQSRLILASTKDNVHRIPLKEGIYGEVTLAYRKGEFVPFPWTYADYKDPVYNKIFKEIRKIYCLNLNQSE